jgi:hypothetical protein
MTKQQFISQLGACTRTLNAQIKQQIIDVKAVDTGRMKNNTKVKIEYDFNTNNFTIRDVNSTFYYKFVDKGTIYIAARKITEKTLKRDKTEKALDKLFDVWTEYMIDREFEIVGIV